MTFGAKRLPCLWNVAICGMAAVASSASGCQVGRKWFQIDSNSRSPVMGIELRADSAEEPASPEPAENATLPVDHVEPEQRRGLRDWLGIPRGEERIPLPTTEAAVGGDVLPLTGPRPEFE